MESGSGAGEVLRIALPPGWRHVRLGSKEKLGRRLVWSSGISTGDSWEGGQG